MADAATAPVEKDTGGALRPVEAWEPLPARFKTPEAREALAVGESVGYRDAVQDFLQWGAVVIIAIVLYKLWERE